MSRGSSIRFEVAFGVAASETRKPANVTLPRVGVCARKPAARVPVRWTLTKGLPLDRETRISRPA